MPIKRFARLRINNLGLVLFPTFVPVKYEIETAKKSSKPLTEEEVLDDIKEGAIPKEDWATSGTTEVEDVPGEEKFLGGINSKEEDFKDPKTQSQSDQDFD